MDDSDLYDAMKEMNKRYRELSSDPAYKKIMYELESFFCCENSETGI